MLGCRFAGEVSQEHDGRAKQTYHVIAQRVKKLFGTEAKRIKYELSK